MKPLWLKDITEWYKLPLEDRLELLRKHYCTGPCGQSSSVMTTRSVTDQTLRTAIDYIKNQGIGYGR